MRRALAIAACAAASTALAAGGGGDSPPRERAAADPDVATTQAAIRAGDWNAARDAMQKAIARDPRNADYHNLYAYSIRKGPNPGMDLVFKHYNEALRLDPKHRGAHEYIGEAYLMVDNVVKAKEHLAQLDKLCTFGCEEYTKLKKEVAAYEQQQSKK